jgi:hypothetical protein
VGPDPREGWASALVEVSGLAWRWAMAEKKRSARLSAAEESGC